MASPTGSAHYDSNLHKLRKFVAFYHTSGCYSTESKLSLSRTLDFYIFWRLYVTCTASKSTKVIFTISSHVYKKYFLTLANLLKSYWYNNTCCEFSTEQSHLLAFHSTCLFCIVRNRVIACFTAGRRYIRLTECLPLKTFVESVIARSTIVINLFY